jgi:carboxynorspermidine decarboxylase
MNFPEQINEHLLPLWQDNTLKTPAFIYDEAIIDEKLGLLETVREAGACHILYSIKALSFTGVLMFIAQRVDGFSTSSAFESRLAREMLGDQGHIHLTSPGIRSIDMQSINKNCDYLSFNSISQWQQYRDVAKNINFGLRINPGLSFVDDERYNPCREYSKLGISLNELSRFLQKKDVTPEINGILIHNNCESEDFTELEHSIKNVCNAFGGLIEKLKWINLGGGYLIHNKSQLEPLCRIIKKLKQQFDLEVFFEPGKAIVGQAGYLVATVMDMFNSDGKTVAILDTTVNHLPEVFEYQYSPQLLQQAISGKYEYRLAGASCLSGDLFGDYYFNNELTVGSRIIFSNVGAYMSVKANMFNGINLPSVYSLKLTGELELQHEYDYTHYRNRL